MKKEGNKRKFSSLFFMVILITSSLFVGVYSLSGNANASPIPANSYSILNVNSSMQTNASHINPQTDASSNFVMRSENNASGSLALSSTSDPPKLPMEVSNYIPVTIANDQPAPTITPYNQLVVVDSGMYSGIEASNLQNLEWFTSTGNIIPSWIQSGDSNSAVSTQYWLKIPFDIPAHSSSTIYLGFLPISVNLFSRLGNEGLAPQLTQPYGNYDNGKIVFPFYENFAGDSLDTSQWQVITSGSGTYSVSNGVTLSESNYQTDMRLVTTSKYTGIVDARVTSQNLGSFRGTGMELATVLPTTSGFQTGYRFFASDNHPYTSSTGHGGYINVASSGTATQVAYNSNNPPGSPYTMTIEWPNSGQEIWENNFQPYLSSSDTSIGKTSTYVSLYAGSDGSNIGTISFSYVLVRSFLPDNVMPSTIAGNVHSADNWTGFSGNDAFYLSTGVTQPYGLTLDNISSSPGYETYSVVPIGSSGPDYVNSSFSIGSGQNQFTGGPRNYTINEIYINNKMNGPHMSITIPLSMVGRVFDNFSKSGSGSSPTTVTNTTLDTYLNNMANVGYGTNVDIWPGETVARNITDLNYNQSTPSFAHDFLASLEGTSVATALIAYFLLASNPYLVLTAAAIDALAGALELLTANGANGGVTQVSQTDGSTPVQQNLQLTNGTFPGFSNNTLPYAYENTYGLSERLVIDIPSQDFGSVGSIVTTAKEHIPGGGAAPPTPSPTSNLTFPLLPAYTLNGLVLDNNNPMKNQEIQISPLDNYTGPQPHYFLKTNGTGGFKFLGGLNTKYEVQPMTPSGPMGTPVNVTTGNNEKYSAVNFNQTEGSVIFAESGLPQGTSWAVTLGGVTHTSSSDRIYFNGTIDSAPVDYQVQAISGYGSSVSSGSITISGFSQNQIVNFWKTGKVSFSESGLPSGDSWSVTMGGQTSGPTTATSISFSNVPYGSYSYSVSTSAAYTPQPSSGTVSIDSSSTTVSISFSPKQYQVQFTEGGLPSGTSWSVQFNGNTKSSSNGYINYYVTDGSYSFTAYDAYTSSGAGYAPTPSSGTITVSGAGTSQHITYSTNGGLSCVYALAPVLLSNFHWQNAENITVGESIMTYNLSTQQLQQGTVMQVFITQHSEMYVINGYLKVARDQDIWTNHGYVQAQNLTLNDTIFNVMTGHYQKVHSVYIEHGSFTMYDFYVNTNHNYIIWSNLMQDRLP